MTYLVEIKSFEDLKAKYREWALKLHPDMGGTDAEMQCSTMNMTSSFQSGRTEAKFTPKKPLILIEDGFTPRTAGQGRITSPAAPQKKSRRLSEPISRKSTAIASGVCVILPLRCVPIFPLL